MRARTGTRCRAQGAAGTWHTAVDSPTMPSLTLPDMAACAHRAAAYLDQDAHTTADFIHVRQQENGGFAGRSADADLYYTGFALACLNALDALPPKRPVAPFLDRFGAGAGLDLIHLCSLVRCHKLLSPKLHDQPLRQNLLQSLQALRIADRTYNTAVDATTGSIFGSFLAAYAYRDLEEPFPELEKTIALIQMLRTPDGAFANDADTDQGTAPVTAAALLLLRHWGATDESRAIEWLRREVYRDGGYTVHASIPLPDLLTTATVLFTLRTLDLLLDKLREPALEFIELHLDEKGGFCSSILDMRPDCEYTWYGLLAMGSVLQSLI